MLFHVHDSLFYVQVAAGFYEPGAADRKMGVRLVRERPTLPTYLRITLVGIKSLSNGFFLRNLDVPSKQVCHDTKENQL